MKLANILIVVHGPEKPGYVSGHTLHQRFTKYVCLSRRASISLHGSLHSVSNDASRKACGVTESTEGSMKGMPCLICADSFFGCCTISLRDIFPLQAWDLDNELTRMGDGNSYGNESSTEKCTRIARSVVSSVKMSIRGFCAHFRTCWSTQAPPFRE